MGDEPGISLALGLRRQHEPDPGECLERSGFYQAYRTLGDFYKVSKKLVEELGQVLVTPAVNYREIATRWTRALLDAYAGKDSVQEALEKAAQDIDGIVKR